MVERKEKMNILVFDTETANLEKPFCYNLGYVIFNTDEGKVVLKRDYVIEQVWHNTMLFTTAYYANKRELYVSRMKGRTAIMDKWGYVCQRLYRDIVEFEITDGYAYNSGFDEKVFEFNCEWFKTINPLDNIKVHDIRGYVMDKIAFTERYKEFCEHHQLLTESGNYSTTAETVYRYVSGNHDFVEEHTALADSEIECYILKFCVDIGCEWNTDYKVPKIVPRNTAKVMTIIDKDNTTYQFAYTSKRKISGQDGFRLYYKEDKTAE
jgi:hypothetical protein